MTSYPVAINPIIHIVIQVASYCAVPNDRFKRDMAFLCVSRLTVVLFLI